MPNLSPAFLNPTFQSQSPFKAFDQTRDGASGAFSNALTATPDSSRTFRESLSDAVESTDRSSQPEKTTDDVESKTDAASDVDHDDETTAASTEDKSADDTTVTDDDEQDAAPVGDVNAVVANQPVALAGETTNAANTTNIDAQSQPSASNNHAHASATAAPQAGAMAGTANATQAGSNAANSATPSAETTTAATTAATGNDVAATIGTGQNDSADARTNRSTEATATATITTQTTRDAAEQSAGRQDAQQQSSSNDPSRSQAAERQGRADRAAEAATRQDAAAAKTTAEAENSDRKQPANSAPTTTTLEKMMDQLKGQRRSSMNVQDPAMMRAASVDAAIRQEQAAQAAQQQTLTADAGAKPVATVTPVQISTTDSLADRLAGTSDGTSAQRLAALDDADQERFNSRVMRGLTALMNQRGGVMNMRLDPPELGQMRVQMTIAGGTVSAVFQSMDPGVQHLLERNLATLRASLESQGLQVDKLSVQSTSAQASSSQQAHQQQQDAQQQANQQAADQRSQADAGNGQSRGRNDDAGDSGSNAQSSNHQQGNGEAMNAFRQALHELEENNDDVAAGAVVQGALR